MLQSVYQTTRVHIIKNCNLLQLFSSDSKEYVSFVVSHMSALYALGTNLTGKQLAIIFLI